MNNFKRLIEYQKKQIRPYPDYANDLFKFMKMIKEKDFGDFKEPLDNKSLMTDKRFTDIVEFINDLNINPNINDRLHRSFNAISRFKPVKFVHKPDKAYEELVKLSEDTEDFYTTEEMFQFMKRIKMYDPVNDVDVDFGNFIFVCSPTSVHANPAMDGSNNKKNGAYHPYVNSETNKLCLGDFSTPYQNAFKELRFFDAFGYIMNVMEIYGGDDLNETTAGPHNPLVLWGGVLCVECNASITLEESIPCGSSKAVLCPACAEISIDEYTGKVHQSLYLDKCTTGNHISIGVKPYKDEGHTRCLHCRQAQRFPEDGPAPAEPSAEPAPAEPAPAESVPEPVAVESTTDSAPIPPDVTKDTAIKSVKKKPASKKGT